MKCSAVDSDMLTLEYLAAVTRSRRVMFLVLHFDAPTMREVRSCSSEHSVHNVLLCAVRGVDL